MKILLKIPFILAIILFSAISFAVISNHLGVADKLVTASFLLLVIGTVLYEKG